MTPALLVLRDGRVFRGEALGAVGETSGEVIFMTILAGTGNVIAPFAGALIYGAIRTTAYDLSPNTWQLSLGTALLLIIVFLPEGLWSLFKRHARHS